MNIFIKCFTNDKEKLKSIFQSAIINDPNDKEQVFYLVLNEKQYAIGDIDFNKLFLFFNSNTGLLKIGDNTSFFVIDFILESMGYKLDLIDGDLYITGEK